MSDELSRSVIVPHMNISSDGNKFEEPPIYLTTQWPSSCRDDLLQCSSTRAAKYPPPYSMWSMLYHQSEETSNFWSRDPNQSQMFIQRVSQPWEMIMAKDWRAPAAATIADHSGMESSLTEPETLIGDQPWESFGQHHTTIHIYYPYGVWWCSQPWYEWLEQLGSQCEICQIYSALTGIQHNQKQYT